MASVKKNIVLNALNTVTSIIFPIITFPYAARVLLPEGIGTVNFLNGIVAYIVLLTSLGIPLYAVKEVAKYQNDLYQRNKITAEILALSFVLCLIGYVAVWVLAEFVPQIHKQEALFYILSLSILFTAIGVNWFYQGIEDFKFITIRAIIIRTIAAISLFIFVHSPEDLLMYGAIVVFSTVGNNFINFIHLRKYIDLAEIKLRELNLGKHIKPALQIFILNLIISLYVQLNTIMLGFMAGEEQVGFYTAGTKIPHIALMLITSIGTVLLPRCSNLLKEGDINGFNVLINKSKELTLRLSLPMMVGLIILATPTILVFCGDEYRPAIPSLLWNTPIIFFISLSTLISIQILYPMDKINLVIISVSGGAIANIIFNFLLIPQYGATGASISVFISEFSVLAIQLIIARKLIPFSFIQLLPIKLVIATLTMGLGVYASILFVENSILQLVIGTSVGILIYFVVLLALRDSLLMETINPLIKRYFSK